MCLVEVSVSQHKHCDRKTIDQPYISGLYLLITHSRSSGPQVNFDKWPVDCVESRRPARNGKYDLSSFLVLMRWFKHLRKSPEFSPTIAIKEWHQCGKTITQWFRKHLAESAGAFLVVIKKRQIAELRHPHTLGGKHHYRGSVALDVYFQSFWKLLQSGNCAAQTAYRKYTALVKMQKCQRTQILVCKDNH